MGLRNGEELGRGGPDGDCPPSKCRVGDNKGCGGRSEKVAEQIMSACITHPTNTVISGEGSAERWGEFFGTGAGSEENARKQGGPRGVRLGQILCSKHSYAIEDALEKPRRNTNTERRRDGKRSLNDDPHPKKGKEIPRNGRRFTNAENYRDSRNSPCLGGQILTKADVSEPTGIK